MQKQLSKGFFKKGGMRNFVEFTRKNVPESFIFDKVKLCRSAASLKTCEFCKICKNTFFAENHQKTASDYSSISRISNEDRIDK